LTLGDKTSILIKPCSRGVSGTLYLQSAIAGVMFWLRALTDAAALYKWRRSLGLTQRISVNRVRLGTKQH